MQQSITIRQGQLSDLTELQELFRDTIINVCKADYTDTQIHVWVAGVENISRWHTMLTQQYVLVAETKGIIVGFCTLEKASYLDFLYIHKDYQSQGIAYKLYKAVETEAIRQNQKKLTADVSKTARPFFEKMGFKVLTEQTVVRQDVALNNFKMEKMLT